MKVTWAQSLICAVVSFSFLVAARNMQSTTARSHTKLLGDSVKKLTGQVRGINITEILTDTRTPPRVKQMMKKVEQQRATVTTTENSHPGIAEPIDDDINVLEESMKKLNFYKLDKPTTNSVLSTWILLSGHHTNAPSTTTPKLLPMTATTTTTVTPNINKKATIISNPNRVIKPIFKKRPPLTPVPKLTTTTTEAPKTTTTLTTIPVVLITTTSADKTTKLAKVKVPTVKIAPVNNNSTLLTLSSFKTNLSNATKKNDAKIVKIPINATTITTSTLVINATTEVVPESKEGEIELSLSTINPKKTRRPTNKKKKNKNRVKRPTIDNNIVEPNKTKISNKVGQKEKPISTQIYNYLAREVMPTVGVGLVGLVVTAGLASYFLYPFGGLRRSYEVDRRDQDYSYYYDGGKVVLDYNSGIAEEEAIGKVIAGMPVSSTSYNNNYQQQNSRNGYTNNRYRQTDSTFYPQNQGTVESVQINPVRDYNKNQLTHEANQANEINKNEPVTYNKDVISQNVEASYITNDNKQFVVGSVPKEIVEEVTPVAVPEHGPRSLKFRRRMRRGTNNYISNEIDIDTPSDKFNEIDSDETTIKKEITTEKYKKITTNTKNTTEIINNNTTENSNIVIHKPYSFIDFFKDLFRAKLKIGLDLLHNQAMAISRYLSNFQDGLNKLRNNANKQV